MNRIFVTGASGQVGSDLVIALRERYGNENVLASDIREPGGELGRSGPFEIVDCTDHDAMDKVVSDFGTRTIYHLAAILSAVGEADPHMAYTVNLRPAYPIGDRIIAMPTGNKGTEWFEAWR